MFFTYHPPSRWKPISSSPLRDCIIQTSRVDKQRRQTLWNEGLFLEDHILWLMQLSEQSHQEGGTFLLLPLVAPDSRTCRVRSKP